MKIMINRRYGNDAVPGVPVQSHIPLKQPSIQFNCLDRGYGEDPSHLSVPASWLGCTATKFSLTSLPHPCHLSGPALLIS